MNKDLFQDQIRKEIIKSEYSRLLLFISSLIIGFLVMGFLFFGHKNVDDFFNNRFTPAFILIWILAFMSYELIMFLIVKSRMKHQKSKSQHLKYSMYLVKHFFQDFYSLMS